MASIEFIEKRIAGKEAELSKLEAKLARIQKAEASGWNSNNPYMYTPYDLKECLNNIDKVKEGLTKYKNDLELAKSKEASRNVPQITEFLDQWEARTIEYFLNQRILYLEEYQVLKASISQVNTQFKAASDKDARKALREEQAAIRSEFNAKWRHVTQFDASSRPWEDTMRKMISEEKARKYDFIIERVVEITGDIQDATSLKVGMKGDLNGTIAGKNGVASVTTIGAGGYNIQCYHYRTLIKRVA